MRASYFGDPQIATSGIKDDLERLRGVSNGDGAVVLCVCVVIDRLGLAPFERSATAAQLPCCSVVVVLLLTQMKRLNDFFVGAFVKRDFGDSSSNQSAREERGDGWRK